MVDFVCQVLLGANHFCQQVSVLFRRTSSFDASVRDLPNGADVAAVGAICTFLHVAFNVLPVERILTKLAYRTELVPMLWNYIKRCHENQTWPSFRDSPLFLSDDTFGWVLPLAVFCPVYKYVKILFFFLLLNL